MSFLTEEPDNVNTLASEDFAMRRKLRQIRQGIAEGKYNRPWIHRMALPSDGSGYWPTSSQASDHVSLREEAWTQRFDHPKD